MRTAVNIDDLRVGGVYRRRVVAFFDSHGDRLRCCQGTRIGGHDNGRRASRVGCGLENNVS